MKRRENPCHWCGRITTATSAVCVECIAVDRRAGHEPTDHYALTGGRWVPRGGVQRWEVAS